MNKVKLPSTDPQYPDQTGTVKMTYYDYKHTGNSPDILYLEMADGSLITRFSNQVIKEGEEHHDLPRS